MTELSSHQMACYIAGLLDTKKAKDIVILDISKVSVMADYFVICSTDASTQLKALNETVSLDLKKNFNRLTQNDNRDKSGKWYLLDYGDVVVHIMHKDDREFYAIEQFWSHAFLVDREEWEPTFENVQTLKTS